MPRKSAGVASMSENVLDYLYASALFFSNFLGYNYPPPAAFPTINIASHEYLVKHACAGKECKVLGWYNDEGIVHIDKRLVPYLDSSPLAQSIVVHEFVHYFQHVSKAYPPHSCEWALEREREAYAVSDTFLVNNGWMPGPHPAAYGTCTAVAP